MRSRTDSRTCQRPAPQLRRRCAWLLCRSRSRVNSMVILVFALPEEARVVRRRIRWDKSRVDVPGGSFAGQEISLAFVGISAVRIGELERSIDQVKPRMIISS